MGNNQTQNNGAKTVMNSISSSVNVFKGVCTFLKYAAAVLAPVAIFLSGTECT
jgi:hypothetical protein